MIITSPKMYIAANTFFLATHHHRHFGVRLEANQSVNDMRARFLEAIRRKDIFGFIKSRHEFDDDSNFLSSASCINEVVDNGRIPIRFDTRFA